MTSEARNNMEYKVNIGYTWETNDMGIANHGTSHKPVPVEDIVEGYNLFSQYHDASPAKVLSFTEGVLVFSFMGENITVKPGHTWNSPMYRIYNPYIYEAGGYLVSVEIVYDKADEKKAANRVVTLLGKMGDNAVAEGCPIWKNIPLAQELLDILHNRLPISGEFLDASEIMFACDFIFIHDLLNQRDVPRLCLEFLQIRKLALEAQKADDVKFKPEQILGVREADNIQNKLDFYIDPKISTEWWIDYVGCHLDFDPVERTPEWEENIYEVEKACDRKLRGVPRGMGFCFEYWSVKKAELAKRGIEWRTPHQMNPKVMFD